MAGRKWSDKETNFLVKNIEINWLGKVRNYQELAEKLERNIMAVRSKVQRLRFDGDLPQIKTDEEFLEYIKQNALFAETNQILNIEELSKEMDICIDRLEDKFAEWRKIGCLPKTDRSHQIDLHGRWYSKSEDNKIIYMKKRNVSNEEIGRLLGRSGGSIKSRTDYLKKSGKLESVYHWQDWEIEVILRNVTFDKYGFVNDYPKLRNLLQGRRSQRAVYIKIIELRKQDKITVKPIPGKTSVAAIKALRKFKDITFAPKKKEQRTSQIVYTHQTKKPTSVVVEVSNKKNTSKESLTHENKQ